MFVCFFRMFFSQLQNSHSRLLRGPGGAGVWSNRFSPHRTPATGPSKSNFVAALQWLTHNVVSGRTTRRLGRGQTHAVDGNAASWRGKVLDLPVLQCSVYITIRHYDNWMISGPNSASLRGKSVVVDVRVGRPERTSGSGDVLFFHYSGHSALHEEGNALLDAYCPSDFAEAERGTNRDTTGGQHGRKGGELTVFPARFVRFWLKSF